MGEVKPYKGGENKKQQVNRMFDTIAPKYDFLNHLLSLGIDRVWRRKALKLLKDKKIESLLDIACGTGDFAFEALKSGIPTIVGVDISEQMLKFANKKANERGVAKSIEFRHADAEQLSFPSDTFGAVTVAFGVRNFENLEKGLSEMYRVLKNNGRFIILEFSKPSVFPFEQLFGFYFELILPFIGKIVSKDKYAYSYLPESVDAFPEGKDFVGFLKKAGFKGVQYKKLTLGVASIYYGNKKV